MRTHKPSAFTLVELMVVLSVIMILAGLILPAVLKARKNATIGAAREKLSAISMALEKYRDDFHAYPPDNVPSTNGSEILAHHLCTRFPHGESHLGPYLDVPEDQLKGATRRIPSPLGGTYVYGRFNADTDGNFRSFALVDPGPDKLPGGSVDSATGFKVTTATEAEDNVTLSK